MYTEVSLVSNYTDVSPADVMDPYKTRYCGNRRSEHPLDAPGYRPESIGLLYGIEGVYTDGGVMFVQCRAAAVANPSRSESA